MRREPDERFHETVKAQVEPEHVVEAQLWRCTRGIETCEHTARATEIYSDMFERERLQPWILAGADNMDICDRTGVRPEMLDVYRHLFFNVGVFRDLFEKQRWVSLYERRQGVTREGALYLQKAMLHGVEAVAHVLGVTSKLEPGTVLDGAMRDTYFRGLAVRDAKLTSAEAAAAHGFLKTSIVLAQEQAKIRPPGVNDILIRIKHRDDTQPLAAAQAVAEILH